MSSSDEQTSENSNKLVLVTGGTGFLAQWAVKYVLDKGYRVRTTVRNVARAQYLKELPGGAERLEVIQADLTKSEDWPDAVKGCTYVLHIASPYSLKWKDSKKELVDPAVNGTLNVLRACKDCPEVKRVVLTSSIAAVSDCFDDWATHVYTDKDWNTTSNLKRNPYNYSKVLAEKAANEFMEKENPGFSLVVINPYVVSGPALDPSAPVNQSTELIRSFLRGEYPINVPLTWGFIDVRDVAEAHVRAMEIEEAAGKRFLLWAGSLHQYEVARVVREVSPPEIAKRIPTKPAPWYLNKSAVVAFIRLKSGKGIAIYTSTNWKKQPKFDCTPAKEILKMEFRDVTESVKETAKWCLENKVHLRKD